MKISNISRMAILLSIIVISSRISINLSAIPITMQTVAIFLVGFLLDVKESFILLTIYLFMGAIGLPVFANGAAGLSVITGVTGGFLVGFLFSSVLISFLKKFNINKIIILLLANTLLYVIGVLWFMFLLKKDLLFTLKACVLPFLVGDIIKISLTYYIANKLEKIIK